MEVFTDLDSSRTIIVRHDAPDKFPIAQALVRYFSSKCHDWGLVQDVIPIHKKKVIIIFQNATDCEAQLGQKSAEQSLKSAPTITFTISPYEVDVKTKVVITDKQSTIYEQLKKRGYSGVASAKGIRLQQVITVSGKEAEIDRLLKDANSTKKSVVAITKQPSASSTSGISSAPKKSGNTNKKSPNGTKGGMPLDGGTYATSTMYSMHSGGDKPDTYNMHASGDTPDTYTMSSGGNAPDAHSMPAGGNTPAHLNAFQTPTAHATVIPVQASSKSSDHVFIPNIAPELFGYIRKMCDAELERIQHSYCVQIIPKNGSVTIVPTKKQSKLNEAYQDFTDIYQTITRKMERHEVDLSQSNIQIHRLHGFLTTLDKAGDVYVTKDLNAFKLFIYGMNGAVQNAAKTLADLESQEANPIAQADNDENEFTRFEHTFAGNKTLTICAGNIVQAKVDCIVNAANKYLDHQAGVAHAISRAGGPVFERASREYYRQHGPIELTRVAVTTGGELPCWVMHVVGPTSNMPDYSQYLRQTFDNMFYACHQRGFASIAIPAVSTGVYGVPKEDCARALSRSFYRNVLSNPNHTLRDVRILDIDPYTVYVMISAFKKVIDENPALTRTHSVLYHAGDTTTTKASSVYETYQIVQTKGYAHLYTAQDDSVKLAKEEQCPICLSGFYNPVKLNKCGHYFCKACIDQALARSKKCPNCNTLLERQVGDQPENGTMDVTKIHETVPCHPQTKRAIQITYAFPNGLQGPKHPNPGFPYEGTQRVAYLPDNEEGRRVLELLKQAFDARLVFTIGTSSTTGRPNCVIWNDIHHKTRINGGPTRYGYPDADYIARVTEELESKGIK